MVSPSYMDRICAMFDSFCKTVSRNYYRDLLRAEKRRNDHYKEEPVDYCPVYGAGAADKVRAGVGVRGHHLQRDGGGD